MNIAVRLVLPEDETSWLELYSDYRAFYHLPDDPTAARTTWEWMRDGQHSLTGFVAVDADQHLVALANLRWFAHPSTATMGLYLDDLFTAPSARGRGAATALLAAAAQFAAREGASVVRWITASENVTARHLYDAHADATRWVTYDMSPTEHPLA